MRRWFLIFVLASLGGGPASADTVIGGWTVSAKPDADGACLAARSYIDQDDDNKKNSVVFGLVKSKAGTQMVMVLGYEDWKFDKDEAVVGDLIVDGKTIYKKWKWEGDGPALTAVFDDTNTMVPVLGAGKKVVLRFGKDGEAGFLIPNAGLALGALQLCVGQAGSEVVVEPQPVAKVLAPAKTPAPDQTLAGTTIGRTALGAGDKPTAVVAFPADTGKISVFVELLTPKVDDKIGVKWIAANTSGTAPGYVIDTSTTTVTEGVKETDASLSKPNAGWPTGDYQIDMSVNGRLAKSLKFTIIK